MSGPSDRSSLLTGIAMSVALHLVAGGLGYLASSAKADQSASEPVVWLDIETPPTPPTAEMPANEDEKARPDQPDQPDQPHDEPEAVDEPAAVVAKPPDPETEPEHVLADAGSDAIPDAGTDAMTDAGMDAMLDAPDDAFMLDAPGDSGEPVPMAEARDGGLADAGPPDDSGAVATTNPSTTPRSPGADANLLAYFPAGELLTVLIRFDRLRTQPWPRLTEAILAPMPDYRSIIGSRDLSITQLFDTLVISSSEPTDVTATTLVGHTRMPGRDARAFVDHAESRVIWQTARGGPLGRRQRSKLVYGKDARVLLMPFSGWMLLCQPRHLGVLVETAAGDIDLAAAKTADLPSWLAILPAIEDEAGKNSGPAMVVTIAGKLLPAEIAVPYAGKIHTPERASAAFEVAPNGFYVRGTLTFHTPEHATEFVAIARKTKSQLAASRFGKVLLSRFHAYNALNGLTLEINGARVGFATSLSIADAQAMLEAAAEATRTLYSEDRKKAKKPAPVPPASDAAPRAPPHDAGVATPGG